MSKTKSNKDLFLAEIENMSDQLLAEVQYFSCAIEENWEKRPEEIDILPFAFGYVISELCSDSLSKSMQQEVFGILNKIGYIKKSKTNEGTPLFVKGKDKYFEVSSWNEFMGLVSPSY